MVWLHHSPQQPTQDSFTENLGRWPRTTGEKLGIAEKRGLEWTSPTLIRLVEDSAGWHSVAYRSSAMSPLRPSVWEMR